MKKFFLKKALAVLSAFGIMTGTLSASIVGFSSSAATQPFISDTDYNGAINIDESQITVNIYKPYLSSYLSTSIVNSGGNSCISRSEMFQVKSGTRINLKLTVKGVSEDEAKSLQLTVDANLNQYGETAKLNQRKYNHTDFKANKDSSNKLISCELTYSFFSYGSEFNFKTSSINSSTLSCESCLVKSDNDYVVLHASSPLENIVISALKVDGITDVYYKNWCKNLSLYCNSLSTLTNITKNTVFIDCKLENGNPHCNNSGELGFYNNFPTFHTMSLTNTIMDSIKNKTKSTGKYLNHVELHELSHAYGIKYESDASKRGDNYDYAELGNTRNNFSNYYNFNLDDMTTNARGIVAIQNCDNLRSMTIQLYNGISGDYKTYLKNCEISEKTNPNYLSYNGSRCFIFSSKLVDIALQTNNWNGIENFFKGKKPVNTNGLYDGFKQYTGATYNSLNFDCCKSLSGSFWQSLDNNSGGNTEIKIKMANTCYKIMQEYWGQTNQFNYGTMEAFLNQYFGKDLIKASCFDK